MSASSSQGEGHATTVRSVNTEVNEWMRNNAVGVARKCGITSITARDSKKAVWTNSRSKSSNSTNCVNLSVDDIDGQGFDFASKPFFRYPAAGVPPPHSGPHTSSIVPSGSKCRHCLPGTLLEAITPMT